jgi:peptidoglycan/LPS O-acetylase OafA/YrhL
VTAPVTAQDRQADLEPPVARRRHLYELDVVRGLTMVGVVGVHTISWTTNPSSVAAGALTILLHFTRESFFTLMAFVLIFSFRQRPVSWRAFWAKRFPFVVIPYVAWTAIYLSITRGYWQQTPGAVAHQFGYALVNGTAWYHLYFLLVTLQIYVLFPLIQLLVQSTRRHHVALLAVSLGLQLAAMSFAQYWNGSRGQTGEWLWNHRNSLVISYQFFVVLGAVAACHVEELLGFFRAHQRAIRCWVAVALVGTVGWYLLAVAAGQSPSQASAVFQPAEVLWSVAAVAALVSAGVRWAGCRAAAAFLRADHPGGRLIPLLSKQSFGIFLVHPLVLNALVVIGFVRLLREFLPDLVAYAIVWPLVLVIATAFAMIASRTPLSLVLTGRRRASRRPTVSSGSSAVTAA